MFSFMSDAKKAYTAHVMGNRLMDSGKTEEANAKHEESLRLYNKAYAEHKFNKPEYYLGYAVMLMRFNQFEKAREVLLETEKIKDLSADNKRQMRIDYSICMWRLGNINRAVELMENVAAGGKNGMIYSVLGEMYIAQAKETGDFTKADEFNKEAYDYDDEDAGTLDNLGQLEYLKGNKEKALEYFLKAHEEKPKQTTTVYYLAKLYHEQGNDSKALEYIKIAEGGNFSALCSVTRDDVKALKEAIG